MVDEFTDTVRDALEEGVEVSPVILARLERVVRRQRRMRYSLIAAVWLTAVALTLTAIGILSPRKTDELREVLLVMASIENPDFDLDATATTGDLLLAWQDAPYEAMLSEMP